MFSKDSKYIIVLNTCWLDGPNPFLVPRMVNCAGYFVILDSYSIHSQPTEITEAWQTDDCAF